MKGECAVQYLFLYNTCSPATRRHSVCLWHFLRIASRSKCVQVNRTNTHCVMCTRLGGTALLSLQCAGAAELLKRWINAAESRCCAYYRGGNDATGLAFTNCLMVVFPSGRLSSECQRTKGKKRALFFYRSSREECACFGSFKRYPVRWNCTELLG